MSLTKRGELHMLVVSAAGGESLLSNLCPWSKLEIKKGSGFQRTQEAKVDSVVLLCRRRRLRVTSKHLAAA